MPAVADDVQRGIGRAVVLIALAWAGCVAAGAWSYRHFESQAGRPLAVKRAVFMSASAATLTGFDLSFATPAGDTAGGRAMTATLLWAGTLASCAVGGLALRKTVTRGVAATLAAAVVLSLTAATVAFGVAGAAAVAGAGRLAGEFDAGGATLWMLALPFAFAGVIAPLLIAGRGRTLQYAAVGMAAAFALSLGLMLLTGGLDAGAAALAIDGQSSGFATAAVAELPAAGRIALIPLMLLGSAPSGTSGGLKVTTALILIVGVLRLCRGRGVGRTVGIAAIWLATLTALFFFTLLALLAALPQLPADRVALLAAGAVGNVSLSVDPITASGADAWVMSAAMVLGRATPWLFLWWSATRGDEGVVVG